MKEKIIGFATKAKENYINSFSDPKKSAASYLGLSFMCVAIYCYAVKCERDAIKYQNLLLDLKATLQKEEAWLDGYMFRCKESNNSYKKKKQ